MREAIRDIVEGNAPKVQGWLDRVAKTQPAKALAAWERLAEYLVPKLTRAEIIATPAPFTGDARIVTDPAEAAREYERIMRGELDPAAVRFESAPALLKGVPE